MNGLRHATLAALAAVMIGSWAGGVAALDIATVAKTGDLAPGAGGATFRSLDFPDLNGAGEVAFQGDLSDGGSGIWLGGPAGLALVAKEGDPAPGAGGATFTVFGAPVLNGAGEVAFFSGLSDGGNGLWLSGRAGLALVVKIGDRAPGAGGAAFTGFGSPVLNSAGEMAFTGGLSDGGRSLWLNGAAGLTLVARTGKRAPGAGGATFEDFTNPVLNGAGEVAFQGDLSAGGGIWRGGPAGLALVARTGDRAPGAGGAAFGRIGSPVLNGAGEVAFLSLLINSGGTDGGSGLWLGGPAGLALVARTGDRAPEAGGTTFTSFKNAVLNGAGEVAFEGGLSDGGNGIWLGGSAGLALVAKTGNPAPGAGGATFSFLFFPVLNGVGEVAFGARLLGGVTSANDRGRWAGKPGAVHLVAREGDDIEVVTGVPRTVADNGLVLSSISGNEDGRPSGLSEGGQAAFVARFTDLSEGIFLSPPDAPTVHRVPDRAVDSAWDRVMLPRSFAKPVIIAGPPGFDDKAPGVVHLRKIQGAKGRFEARFQEWRYLDGKHPEERADFLVLEEGRQDQADGSIWEAGTLTLKGNRLWKKQRFTTSFPAVPKVFVTVQSFKGGTAVAARVRNVTGSGFQVSIQEEEKDLRGRHPKEIVGYLAVFSGQGRGTITGGVAGSDYRVSQTKMKHRFKRVLGERLKLEEEKSKDKETKHKKETVSVMTLGRGLFAQQASDKERDTTAVRRR